MRATKNRISEARTSRGFTLIEIMAVVLIMGLLMGLVGVAVFAQVDKARIATTKAKITQVENALEFYRMDNGRYPSNEQGLDALVNKPSGTPEPRNYPPGGYLKSRDMLLDSWQQPLNYESPGQNNPHTFDLWSWGADGVQGGSEANAEVTNWDAEAQG